MNTSKIVFATLALALIMGISTLVSTAQQPQGPPPPDGGGQFGGPPRRVGPPDGGLHLFGLNLTDDQKSQIKQINDRFRDSAKGLEEQLRTSHDNEMNRLQNGSTFNEAEVRAAAQARANVMVELDVARARMMSEIYNVLTAEQKAQLAQRQKEFGQRMQERRERRQAPPPDQQR